MVVSASLRERVLLVAFSGTALLQRFVTVSGSRTTAFVVRGPRPAPRAVARSRSFATRDADADARRALDGSAKRGRTWTRLSDLVRFALDDDDDDEPRRCETIADVGCDHGLLAVGLAASGRYERVFATDRSARAVETARTSYRAARSSNADADTNDEIVFLAGDGLEPLRSTTPTEGGRAVVDVVCVAGMGVESMLDVLAPDALDEIGCRRLILQPATSRPRHLVRLYDALQRRRKRECDGDGNRDGDGTLWRLNGERVTYLPSRFSKWSKWYVTSSFVRRNDDDDDDDALVALPGSFLRSVREDEDPDVFEAYRAYVDHHVRWLEQDGDDRRGSGRRLGEADQRWLASLHWSPTPLDRS